tara:strand:+ start:8010 stop:8549 length:540 start_codon:yes stop_codon:yes gene_type:complete
MRKLLGILLILFVLGCENETTDLDDILTNPLDENQVNYEVPAFVFNPNQYDVDLVNTFSAEVFAMGVENLVGANALIQYDPVKLSLVNVKNGDLASGTGGSIPMFFFDNSIPGIVEIVAVYLNSDSVGVSGNIKIAELVFSAATTGESELEFLPECEMLDPNDNTIEILGFANGVVNAQ